MGVILVCLMRYKISIHAPREGGDDDASIYPEEVVISIHAPREGGDYCPHRGNISAKDFNPRPPRGGRLRDTGNPVYHALFQSTPPARGATAYSSASRIRVIFQSTPPARGAT